MARTAVVCLQSADEFLPGPGPDAGSNRLSSDRGFRGLVDEGHFPRVPRGRFFLNASASRCIGAASHDWDGIWLVRWPSKKAFFDMMNHPDFAATQEIRVNSLEAMALILTSELPDH